MDALWYLLVSHLAPACRAAVCFVGGMLAALPMLRWNTSACQRACACLLRWIVKLFGRDPGFLRIACTIFLFNGTAMFAYMSLGFHPLAPMLLAATTGLTTALCLSAPQTEDLLGILLPGPHGWIPPHWLAIVCCSATAAIELPCFLYSVGMGITLGEGVTSHRLEYLSGLQTRAGTFVASVLPLLLVSALCETAAIRGAGSRRTGRQLPG